MSALVFVDTNVLLYARDAGQPRKQPVAQDWLATLWRTRSGRISTQVLSEYYVNATRKLAPRMPEADAWDDVRALLQWRPRAVDADLLQRGREVMSRHRLGWWDSLVVAAARAEGCAILLSEDLQDGGVYGGVTVRDPFRMSLAEREAVYAAVPERAESRLRPRGRPRRATRTREQP
jgi:predicted nucleic acid-binding protein